MKAFVIQIPNHELSVKAAQRCINSGRKFGVEVVPFNGFTPADNPEKLFEEYHLPLHNFISDSRRYSRYENVLSCFLSHHALWKGAAALNETRLILEHDAVFVDALPSPLFFDRICTLARPSYGKFNTPERLGLNPLTQANYFKGAHGYIISPVGARLLLDEALLNAAPTDVFLNKKNFPDLQEYYPWRIEAKDSFTTVQKESGCYAKHNYNEEYSIV